MYLRGPYDRRIELHEPSFLHPLLKSFLIVAVIGALGGGGYLLARFHVIDPSTFNFATDPFPQVAATASYSAPQREKGGDTASTGGFLYLPRIASS